MNTAQSIAIHAGAAVNILKLNPPNIPMVETDFYQWLNEHHSPDWHFITDLSKYLETKGFKPGVDYLSEEELSVLKNIYSYHFYINGRQKFTIDYKRL